MRFAKTLADAYGITEDYAILLEATWHRQTPTQDELREDGATNAGLLLRNSELCRSRGC